jgi:threonylcarbamoyladenosine tRNA methylthiotransferase MtaB
LQIVFNGDESLIGQLCRVKVTEAGVNECRAEFVGIIDSVSAGKLQTAPAV